MFIKLSPSRRKYYLVSCYFFLIFVLYVNRNWFTTAFKELFVYSPNGSWCSRCHSQAFLPRISINLTTDPDINQPSACSTNDPFGLIVITSSPKNVANRNQLRKTWITAAKKYNFVVLFAIGSSNNDKLITQENDEFKDIIKWPFQDAWRNLTLKTVGSLLWHQNYCSNAKFFIKADDDAIVNAKQLHNYLVTLDDKPILVGQLLRSNSPCFGWWKQRHCIKEKYHKMLNYIEYYPPYPAGPMYILSKSSVSLLTNKIIYSSKLQIFFLEDVFVTLLALDSGIKVIDNSKFYFCNNLHERSFEINAKNAIVVYDCTRKQIETIWQLMIT